MTDKDRTAIETDSNPDRKGFSKKVYKHTFELKTEALGWVRCGAVISVMRDNIREQIKTNDLDGPTFVRKLLGRVAQRIEEGQGDNDDRAKIGTPLSEPDIQHLTDTEIESFARKIADHNIWLFESYKDASRSVQTNEKGERVVSTKLKKVKLPKSDDERDSDYLVRAGRRYMTEQNRREKHDLRHVRSTLRALEPIRRQHKELFQFAKLSSLALPKIAEFAEVMRTHQYWQRMIDQTTAMSRMTDLTHAHRTWLHDLKSAQDQTAQLQIAVKSSLGSIENWWAVSERLFAGIDYDAIRLSRALPELDILKLQASVTDITAFYGKLAESIRTYPDITHLPKFVLPGATREVFVTGYAVNMLGVSDEEGAEQASSEVQISEIEVEASMCIPLLEAVDPDLAKLYTGARAALRGTNPDRARHFLSSLRELWSHLLRQIAPDKQVLEWIPKDGKKLLYKGKPTREARILYLCRNLNNGPLSDFIKTDTHAFIELYNVFNRIHKLNPKLSDQELRALQLRTDSWLTYTLQIREESQ